jgi:hypothetical protein
VIRITFRLPYFDWVKKELPARIWGRAIALGEPAGQLRNQSAERTARQAVRQRRPCL